MRWTILVLIALAGTAVGFAAGFLLGRQTGPVATTPSDRMAPSDGVAEVTGLFPGPRSLGESEVFYPRPFAGPPELTVREEKTNPNFGWEWHVTEQRRDGFRVRFSGSGGSGTINQMRYTARGTY
jgi:hypothetical protein